MFGFLDRLALDRGLTILLCSVALALLCVEICFAVVRGKMQAGQVLGYICKSIVAMAVAVLAGFLMSLLRLTGNWIYVAFYGLALVAVGRHDDTGHGLACGCIGDGAGHGLFIVLCIAY